MSEVTNVVEMTVEEHFQGFLSVYNRKKQSAKEAGENSVTIDLIPFGVFERFTGHIANRNVKDHVKGDYLKGKIDPVKRDSCRSVTLIELDEEANADLMLRIKEESEVNSLPFILGDAHCRYYAWFKAAGDENGFRFERPATLKITVLFGLSDSQTVDYLKHRGDKDSNLSAKDERVISMKEAAFDLSSASKFLLSPWKSAIAYTGKDLKQGLTDFKGCLETIDSWNLAIEPKKNSPRRQISGVKAAMLSTYSADDSALWETFWRDFHSDVSTIRKAKTLREWLTNEENIKPGTAGDMATKTQAETVFKDWLKSEKKKQQPVAA